MFQPMYDYEAVRSRKQLEHGFTYNKALRRKVSDFCEGCGRERFPATLGCVECCGIGLLQNPKVKTILRKKKKP